MVIRFPGGGGGSGGPVFPPRGGGGGGGGGGQTGGATGGASSFIPFLENGGFQATGYLLFVPAQSVNGGNAYIGSFAPNAFDDQIDGSTYNYRIEDIAPNRVPTVHRVVITYRNLGVATLTVNVSVVDDNNTTFVYSQTRQIGNSVADNTLLTAFFDIQATGFRPQVNLTRAAAGGPVSIIRVSLIGEIEEVTL